jgi:hypothetical protein
LGRIGGLNALYLLLSLLVFVLSVGVFWGSAQMGAAAGPTLGPLVVISCLTVGFTLLFFLWAIVDLVSDLGQIAVAFENERIWSSIRRAADVIQSRLGAVVGIGLILFLVRGFLVVVFGVANLMTNFIFGKIAPVLVIPSTVLLWFVQSVLLYYLYIVSLASFACLFESQEETVQTPLPVPGKILYEH